MLVAIAVIGSNVYAQSGDGEKLSPAKRAAQNSSELKKELGLTDEQTADVREAMIAKSAVVRPQNQVIKEHKAKIKEANKKIKGAKKVYSERLKTILSEEQNKKHEAIKKQKKANASGGK